MDRQWFLLFGCRRKWERKKVVTLYTTPVPWLFLAAVYSTGWSVGSKHKSHPHVPLTTKTKSRDRFGIFQFLILIVHKSCNSRCLLSLMVFFQSHSKSCQTNLYNCTLGDPPGTRCCQCVATHWSRQQTS